MRLFIKCAKNFAKGLSLALCALYLTGCASYNATALGNLSPDFMMKAVSESNLAVAAKAFTKADCKRYLDRDLLSKGYQPVQLFIQNQSNKSYGFALNRISLPHARPEEVTDKVHTSTIGRIVGYAVGSLLLWPLAIPAIIDGVASSHANESLDQDFYSKSAKDQILTPYSNVNTLIFVPRADYTNHFTITLIDLETNEPVSFDVLAN